MEKRKDQSIRRLSVSDASELSTLAQSTFVTAFGPKIHDAGVKLKFNNYVLNGYSLEKMESLLKREDCWCFGMIESERLIGFIQCSAPSNQSLDRGDDCLEVDRLYVESKRTGEAIGARLLNYGISHASTLGKSKVWLRVWCHNPDAIRFYERFDFKEVGRAEDKWKFPGDFDYVLEMEIKKAT